MRTSFFLIIVSFVLLLVAGFVFSAAGILNSGSSGLLSLAGQNSGKQLATHHSHPTMVSLQGTVEGLTDGNLGVVVSDQNSCESGILYGVDYENAVQESSFNLLLGDQQDLNLNYNQDYYLCLSVNGELVDGPQLFRGGQGQIGIEDVNVSGFATEFVPYDSESKAISDIDSVDSNIYLGGVTSFSTSANWDPSANLVAHWKMNDNNSNSTIDDNSNNNYDATAQHNTDTITISPGKINRAINFNGSGYYATAGTTIGNFGTSPFSISFWARTTENGSMYLLSKRGGCSCSNFWNFRISSGKIGLELSESGCANYALPETQLTYNDGNWHNIIGIRNGTSVKVYIDGELKASSSTAAATNLSNTNNFLQGGNICSTNFTGELDDIRVYNKELNSSEIAGLYSSGNGTEEESGTLENATINTGYIIFGAKNGTSCTTTCNYHELDCYQSVTLNGTTGSCSLNSADYYCWCGN